MNVSLSPQLETWINDKVQTGLYSSASEVIREALRLLREQDEIREIKLNELKRAITVGMADIQKERLRIFDDHLVSEILATGRSSIAERSK
jgi:antitoxin ParD1/3/4